MWKFLSLRLVTLKSDYLWQFEFWGNLKDLTGKYCWWAETWPFCYFPHALFVLCHDHFLWLTRSCDIFMQRAYLIKFTGLCSKGTVVPQVTNFFLWVTRSTYFFHVSFMLGALELIVWNLWTLCNFSKSTALVYIKKSIEKIKWYSIAVSSVSVKPSEAYPPRVHKVNDLSENWTC